MEEYLKALEELNIQLAKTVESHQALITHFAVKIHQLETSVQTGAWYPIENAVQDLKKKVA